MNAASSNTEIPPARLPESPASLADRAPVEPRRSKQRSKVTNGSSLLPGVDNRSAWIRRARDIIAAHLADLGGEDNTSAAERSIVRRAAVLTAQLEQLEVKFALADGVVASDDLDLYQRAAGSLRRLLEAVGLERRAKDVGPSLGDLLRQDLQRGAAQS